MKKFLKDKRGSSLVLVLITMTFLILLAGAIITMTITNIWLKASQKKSQENFYTTDSVLDSVAAGIQNESSKVSSEAYAVALAEYNASLTAADDAVAKKYTKSYLSGMIEALSGGASVYADGTTDYVFSDDVIKSYLTAEEISSYIGDDTGANKMILQNDSLILKNISVYKKEGSYETKLTTDICVDVPMVTTDAHSEYLDYAILADNQILLNGIKTAVINGNIYAGTVKREANQVRSQQGIRITNGGTMTVNARYIISRGDIALADKGTMNISGDSVGDAEVWVENITTDADPDGDTGQNTLSINGICNVADDMELNGQGDRVSVTGKYFGYNYNDDYSDQSKLAVDASNSSAISLNGKECSLDFEHLTQLVLAGRTFISKKSNTTAEESSIASAGAVNTDIELGESLTVKSSQLAYYVPSDYVMPASSLKSGSYSLPAVLPGEATVNDGTSPAKDWLFFDVNGSVYAFDYQAYNEYVMPDATAYADALQNITGHNIIHNAAQFDIRDYIGSWDSANNIYKYTNTMPLKVYYRHDTRVSSTPIKYFYLNFDTSNGTGGKTNRKASIFYAVFHDKSPQQTGVYDEVDDRYLSSNGIKIDETSNCILLNSGNILYSKPGLNRMQVKLQNTEPMANSALAKYATSKSKEYMSRQLALIADYSDAKSSPLWRLPDVKDSDLSKSGVNNGVKVSNLFNKLVDESKLGTQQIKIETVDGEQTAYVTSNANVTWPLSSPYNGVKNGIIITSGNVTINGEFNGLIIAGGDVTIGATGVIVNANKKLVENALKLDKDSGSPMIYQLLSKYFRKSVDATIGTSGTTDINNVNFENWKKNE